MTVEIEGESNWRPVHDPVVLDSLDDGSRADLWLACHGYESRSLSHLELPQLDATERISFGFDFPSGDKEVEDRINAGRSRLETSGYEIVVGSDDEVCERIRREIGSLPNDREFRVVADISSMNRIRIATVLLECLRRRIDVGGTLDLVYYPSSFDSHKHLYEPLESFGPIHDELAGWPDDPDLPLGLVIGLGTEPRRGDGVLESLEPDIVSLFEPTGDEPKFSVELIGENRRVIDAAGGTTPYGIRDPEHSFGLLLATVDRLKEKARVVIVPLGPKIFTAISILVALASGPTIGVWKASAGRGIQPVDVKSHGLPVVARVVLGPLGR